MNDPLFFVFAIPAVLLIGISKGFGGLFVSLAVPLLALRIDPVQAAAILLPILCLADLVALAQFRKSFNRHHIKIMVPGALVGIALASILMGTLPSHAIRLIIGFIAISFCVNHWFFKRFTTERKPGKHAGYFWGFVAGFVSTQAHAGGPPMAIYLFPQRMDKVTLAGTMVVFIAIVNYVKLIPYTLLGQFNAQNLFLSLVLAPLVVIGVRIGYWVLHKVEQRVVYHILYTLLFLTGCKLVVDGLNPYITG